MFSFSGSPLNPSLRFRSRRKTLQRYKQILNLQNFRHFFQTSVSGTPVAAVGKPSSPILRRASPRGGLAGGGTSVPESECKGRRFSRTHQTFPRKSSPKPHYLTFVHTANTASQNGRINIITLIPLIFFALDQSQPCRPIQTLNIII